MAHRFQVGKFVDFKPTGSKTVGHFKIIQLLPEEFRAADWRYRVKSDQEAFERTVFEWALSPSIIPEAPAQPVARVRRAGSLE
jgi:hypothetical protein